MCGKLSGYAPCGTLRGPLSAGGLARPVGRATVVPWMLLNGTVGANVGRFLARTWVAASNPDASLISVGSLKAVPKKLIPSGTPKTIPAGTWTIG